MMRCVTAIALLSAVVADGSFDVVPTTPGNAGSAAGCGGPELGIRHGAERLPTGVFYVNDKSKGMAWLVAPEARKAMAVELHFATGNHEAALSPDKRTIAAPWYENVSLGETEGGGSPGDATTLIDLNSGAAFVAPVGPSPFGHAKPHGPAWTDDGDLLLTQQLKNGIARFSLNSQKTQAYDLSSTGCETPHLVRLVPNSTLAVTGCRHTNGAEDKVHPGMAAVFDLNTGEAKALPGARWDEGITVTASGDTWVGALLSDRVFVFGFDGRPKTIDNFRLITTLDVPFPLRLAYDPVTNTVAVGSLDQAQAAERLKLRKSFDDILAVVNSPNLFLYDAKSRELLHKTAVATSRRGQINIEGLHADDGFIFAPGYDSGAMAILDAKNLEVVMEVYYPFCTAPDGFCTPTLLSNWETAKAEGHGGYNNWSGGICPATMRNPGDRRVIVLDGPMWAPLTPSWARNDEHIMV